MDRQPNLTPVTDLYKLSVLDLHRITPDESEYNGRYWAFFSDPTTQDVLAAYDAGRLKVVARDFVAAINRTKDRIFEMERAHQQHGDRHGTFKHR